MSTTNALCEYAWNDPSKPNPKVIAINLPPSSKQELVSYNNQLYESYYEMDSDEEGGTQTEEKREYSSKDKETYFENGQYPIGSNNNEQC